MSFNWVEFFATGFYSGKLKPAPGTWGTLVGIPIAYGVAQFGELGYMGATLFVAGLAIFVSELYQKQKNVHDPSEIVIDEIAGILVGLTWVPFNWKSLALGFLLFRLLDITKPPPIRQLDRKLEGGFGVVADDLAAGLITNVILQIILSHTTWLH